MAATPHAVADGSPAPAAAGLGPKREATTRYRLPGAWLLVAAAVAWNLVNLRAETLAVPYLNDSSLHEQMVRFAALQLQGGHFPLTTWFPYLGLGSAQFLHYQSLPAILTGVAGLAVGPDIAFRWSLYLLLSAWPISVYLGARFFGLSRAGGSTAAVISPFLMSAAGIGYEQKAYLWIGYGVWTQLWASITLPLAWGLSWRAIRTGRGFLPAAAMVALTVALHFETGYLALMPLLLWPLLSRKAMTVRVRRGALLLCGSFVASAWVIVPLVAERSNAATNEILRGSPLENGYGAGRVLDWLVSGQLLDAGRLPVVTAVSGIGLMCALIRWRQDQTGRALVVVLAACLLLSFGRTTFGALTTVVPASGDIFFRRFMMGAQLAALLLAGWGVSVLAHISSDAARAWISRSDSRARRWVSYNRGAVVGATVAGLVLLYPAWSQLAAFDRRNADAVGAQRYADDVQGRQLDRLVSFVKGRGGGRVYAGMPTNWGRDFTVGAVPVFKYLESRDIDEVGYTLRTASLMTDPEFYFDERNAGDYRLFGIRFLLLPADRRAPVRAHRVDCEGEYCLWQVSRGGYVSVGRVVGTLDADRATIGVRNVMVLRSTLPGDGAYFRVVSSGRDRDPLRLSGIATASRPGTVAGQTSDLVDGTSSASVRMRSAGIAVLSASFDTGWTARVDGRPARPFAVSPALTAVNVPAGDHTVTFRYSGFPYYLVLFLVGGISLGTLAMVDTRRRNR